jgi:hypothetical protein
VDDMSNVRVKPEEFPGEKKGNFWKWNSELENDQIPVEKRQAGGNTLRSELHKLTKSIWNKDERPQKWKGSIIAPIYKDGDKTDCSY